MSATSGTSCCSGATGSGKSTLANFLRACWMQYPHAQAKVFDLDGHARLLTYLLGGTWHDLGSPTLRLQPLRYVDDPLAARHCPAVAPRSLCGLWHSASVRRRMAFSPAHLDKLAQLPPAERTLSRCSCSWRTIPVPLA